VRTILALVKGMTDERLAISQLVRFAIAEIGMGTTWELLHSPDVREEQLAAVQRDWNSLEFLQATEASLAMERAMIEKSLEDMRRSSATFRSTLSLGSGQSFNSGNWLQNVGDFAESKGKETLWRLAWSYPDELRALQAHQTLLETIRHLRAGSSFKSALQQQEAEWVRLGFQSHSRSKGVIIDLANPDLRTLFSSSAQSLERMAERLELIEASRQLTMTAIALERFRLKHGAYPSAPSALVPEFLPSTPRDPVDGQPLRYRLDTDGTFVLYSIGEDAADNGGDPTPATPGNSSSWRSGRDWVWPQPAAAADIEKYFAEQARKRERASGGTETFRKRYGLDTTFQDRYGIQHVPAANSNGVK
jgi:hypothetical protein